MVLREQLKRLKQATRKTTNLGVPFETTQNQSSAAYGGVEDLEGHAT
jgi:hypothetical protein